MITTTEPKIKNPKRVAAGKKASERREQIKNELRKHKMPIEEPETAVPIITVGIVTAAIFGIYMFYNTPKPKPATPKPAPKKEENMYME